MQASTGLWGKAFYFFLTAQDGRPAPPAALRVVGSLLSPFLFSLLYTPVNGLTGPPRKSRGLTVPLRFRKKRHLND